MPSPFVVVRRYDEPWRRLPRDMSSHISITRWDVFDCLHGESGIGGGVVFRWQLIWRRVADIFSAGCRGSLPISSETFIRRCILVILS